LQTKYRTYRAKTFLFLLKEAQRHQQYLHKTATVIQKAFRGMKGRQFYEISRNVLALYAIAGPIQAQLKALATQEADVRRKFEAITSRIKAQEVRHWITRRALAASHPIIIF
jgi:hypothetical protein